VRAAGALGALFTAAVSIVSPGRALQQTLLRQAYERSYQAADYGRLNQHRVQRVRDPDSELNGKLPRIRSFAREEVRNNGFARRAKHGHRNRVIGDCDVGQGLDIQPSVLLPDGTADDKTNRVLTGLWERYRDNLHISGKLGWVDVAAGADYELMEAGEVLAVLHKRASRDDVDLPLCIETLEPDRLPTQYEMFQGLQPNGEFTYVFANGETEKRVLRHGIEYRLDGCIMAYHILKVHPGNQIRFSTPLETERVPVQRVIHYFDPERFEQSRGVSAFVAALPLFADLRELCQWELVAAKMQSVFGIHFPGSGPSNVQNPLPSPYGNQPPRDAMGNTVDQLQPGMVTYGPQAAQMYSATRPGGTFLPFHRSLVAEAAGATDQGYSAVSNDYSQGAYSALRKEANDQADADRTATGLHARHLCGPLWRAFVKACASAGKIDAGAYAKEPHRLTRYKVKLPRQRAINPVQEVQAYAMEIANGLAIPDAPGSGMSIEDVVAYNAKIAKLADSLGLALPWAKGVPVSQINAATDPLATAPADGNDTADKLEAAKHA
jgi:lambda family phage portal protein